MKKSVRDNLILARRSAISILVPTIPSVAVWVYINKVLGLVVPVIIVFLVVGVLGIWLFTWLEKREGFN